MIKKRWQLLINHCTTLHMHIPTVDKRIKLPQNTDCWYCMHCTYIKNGNQWEEIEWRENGRTAGSILSVSLVSKVFSFSRECSTAWTRIGMGCWVWRSWRMCSTWWASPTIRQSRPSLPSGMRLAMGMLAFRILSSNYSVFFIYLWYCNISLE